MNNESIMFAALFVLTAANFVLYFIKMNEIREYKSDIDKRVKALGYMVDTGVEISKTDVKHLNESIDVVSKRCEQLADAINGIGDDCDELTEQQDAMNNRLFNLETGMIPDYEAAKKAADAVNDFSKGIAGIINFDPYAALHKDEQQ